MSEPLDLEAIRERAERAMDAPGIPLSLEVAALIGLAIPALIEEAEQLREALRTVNQCHGCLDHATKDLWSLIPSAPQASR